MKKLGKDEGSILSTLFRKMVRELDEEERLPGLIAYYQNRMRKSPDKMVASTTINGYIKAPSISWKVFLFLLKDILLIKRLKIKLEAERENGKVYCVTHDILNLTPKHNDEEEDKSGSEELNEDEKEKEVK